MNFETQILSLQILVTGLLTRISQLEAENSNLRKKNTLLRQENSELKFQLERSTSGFHKSLPSNGMVKSHSTLKQQLIFLFNSQAALVKHVSFSIPLILL